MVRVSFLIALCVCCAPMVAFAGGDDVSVTLDELALEEHSSKVAVKYAITSTSWRELEDANIQPRLNIYTKHSGKGRYVYRFSQPLKQREGVVKAEKLTASTGLEVRVEIVGFGEYQRIDAMAIKGRRSEGFVLTQSGVESKKKRSHKSDVRKGHKKKRRRSSQAVQIAKACADHHGTTTGFYFEQCLDQARALDHARSAQIIEVCSARHGKKAFYFERCLEKAKALEHVKADRIISVCSARHGSDTFYFDQCLEKAKSLEHTRAAQVVRACDERYGTNSTFYFDKCLEMAKKLKSDEPDHIVALCSAQNKKDDHYGFEACVEKLATLDR